jgi:transposase-like protein
MESERRQFWRRLVEEHQRAHASYQAVASKYGVKPSTLIWWSRQFKKELEVASSVACQPGFLELSALVPTSSTTATLEPPDVPSEFETRAQSGVLVEAGSSRFSGVELQLSRHMLRLSTNFDAATLNRALDVLELRR